MNKLLIIYFLLVLFVIVNAQPTITLQPEDVSTTEGKHVSFKCEFEGSSSSNKAYQWWKSPGAIKLEDNDYIYGANSNRLSLQYVDIADDSTTYTCECINLSTYPSDSSWVNSRPALLRVSRGQLKIESQPMGVTVFEGNTAELYCEFYGANDRGYQWWKQPGNIKLEDDENIKGTKSHTLTLSNVSESDEGYYSCECIDEKYYPGDSSWVMSDTVLINVEEQLWSSVESNTDSTLYEIKFLDSLNGIAWGNEVLIITENGGENWIENKFQDSLNFYEVIFIDKNVGWGVVKDSPSILYNTLDGGLNWLKIFGYPDAEEFKISFIDSNTGWIIGKKMDSEHHYFVTTKDGGNSWIDLPRVSYEVHGAAYYRKLINLFFISDSVGFVNYYYGSVSGGFMKTIDGGLTWDEDNRAMLEDVWFVDDTSGWGLSYDLSGASQGAPYNYFVTKYKNAPRLKYNRFKKLYDIYGQNSLFAWIIGYNSLRLTIGEAKNSIYYFGDYSTQGNFIKSTQNGGEDWDNQYFDMRYENRLRNIYSYDNKTIWVVGDDGMIFKYNIPDDPLTKVKNNVTVNNKITLHQNYPNPFNPTTTIKYSIPNVTSSFSLRNVTLKVYDVLGKEVAILVNQEQNSGNYEVDFNSEGLSSGIYFYTLKVGEFLDTKKMILVK